MIALETTPQRKNQSDRPVDVGLGASRQVDEKGNAGYVEAVRADRPDMDPAQNKLRTPAAHDPQRNGPRRRVADGSDDERPRARAPQGSGDARKCAQAAP